MQSNLFTNKCGSLSSRFLNLLMLGADLIVNESAFHAGALLLLKVNFLPFVLQYSMHNLSSAFLMFNLFGVKSVSNFKYSIWLIIWIMSPVNHLYFKVGKSSSFILCSSSPLRYLSVYNGSSLYSWLQLTVSSSRETVLHFHTLCLGVGELGLYRGYWKKWLPKKVIVLLIISVILVALF